MQVDADSKMIYVHIPRTGGNWFSYAWDSHVNMGHINLRGKYLRNSETELQVECGRHGRLSSILEKLQRIQYDYSDHKIITLVRHPIDRVLSSWVWFSKVKGTAEKHGWKSIHDMIDTYEKGQIRVNYMPQTYWLREPGARFDHIFKFEDLLEGPEVVQKHFPLFWKNKRSSYLIRQGRIGGYQNHMTKDEIERVKKVYKDDIDHLKVYYEDLQ